MAAGRHPPLVTRMRGGLFALLVVIALGTAAGVTWWMGGLLSAAVPREVGPPPASLPGATAVSFPGASGARIHAWFAAGRPDRGTVVLAHARGRDRRQMRGRAEFLQQAGYSVLLYDARAHGESAATQTTFGHQEAVDAAAAVAFARARQPGSPVAFLGVSLGGAAALLGPAPLPVSALVLEAVYSTLREAVDNRIAIRLGDWGRLLSPLLLWQLKPRLGVPAEAIAPIRGIREIQAPLLLVAGERDRHSTLEQSRALYAAAPDPKELWVVPEAAHVDFYRVARSEYEDRILDFLQRNLGQTATEEPP